MTAEERKRVAEVTLEEAGDTPVIVHVGTADARSAAELTAHARALGVAAVSAVGPF